VSNSVKRKRIGGEIENAYSKESSSKEEGRSEEKEVSGFFRKL
jgi:hypothetical protein